MIRLDKLLSQSGERTRSEAQKLVRAGQVRVDDEIVADPARKVRDDAAILLGNQAIVNEPYRYYMLHKPSGLLTAARDANASTVMSLVPEAFARRDVLPVGRLDKDTTGLLLMTNDGELAHRLLAPKRHVVKEYHAVVDGALTQADVDAFADGIILSDFTAKPARMQIIQSSAEQSVAKVWLTEGKFHQVKRMFGARGRTVLSLHRDSFGPLRLDIPEGAYRSLREDELAALRDAANG